MGGGGCSVLLCGCFSCSLIALRLSEFGVVEDDDEVKALKARFQEESAAKIAAKKKNPNFSATAKLSALEKAAGKRHNPGITIEEQVGA